jgi:hypothetical protein
MFAGFVAASFLTPWAPTVETADALDILAVKLMWANLILGVFNLLPCFPMDGGRVLRAMLAIPLPRLRATEIAVGIGSLLAGAFVIVGLYLGHIGLIVVAVVVFLLGQAELAGVRMQAARREWEEWASGGGPPADPDTGDTGDELPAPPVGRGFTGLVWDDARRVWIQYVNGEVVRVIDPSA